MWDSPKKEATIWKGIGYTLSNFKSNALWGGTVLKNDGTVKGAVRWVRWYGTVGTVGTHRTVPTVPTVPYPTVPTVPYPLYPPYPPYRTHRKCHMYLPVLNHQKTCFSFLLKLDKLYHQPDRHVEDGFYLGLPHQATNMRISQKAASGTHLWMFQVGS